MKYSDSPWELSACRQPLRSFFAQEEW